MTQTTPQPGRAGLASAIFAVIAFIGGPPAFAQSSTPGATPTANTQPAPQTAAQTSAQASARRRAARRRQRLAAQQAAQPPQAASSQVGPTSAQRTRDAQILAAQKAQSNAIATENDALTRKVIEDQQKQQAEPRIQDAPGPGSTPLPGDPAVMPAQSPNQTSDPPRIQDAPGPSQTLPKPPAPQP